MRTTKELLELMLLHQDKFKSGLCGLVVSLEKYDVITINECCKLHEYIYYNYPLLSIFRHGNYYWKRGNIKPRIKWINKHIKRLS